MTERDERDEFDRIVEGLELDLDGLPDLDEAAAEHARVESERERSLPEPDEIPAELREDSAADEEPFYRQVPPARLRPARSIALAWTGVASAPLLVVLSAIFGFWVPSGLLAVLTLVAVSSAAWLVWQLPERGPSQRDWPDDGAAL